MEWLMSKVGRFIAPLVCILAITAAFTLSPGLRASANSWVSGFLRDTNGYLVVNCTNCTTPTGVQSVAAGDTTITVGGTSQNPTVALNRSNADAFSAVLSNTSPFQALGAGGAGACAGTNAPPTLGLCIGANNVTNYLFSVTFGPAKADYNCTVSCTAGDSTGITFFDSTTAGATQASQFYYGFAYSGQVLTSPLYLGGRLGCHQNSCGGQCTTASAATCTVTLSQAFAHPPLCVADDVTNFVAVKCGVSGSTVTATLASSATADVINIWVWGNFTGGL